MSDRAAWRILLLALTAALSPGADGPIRLDVGTPLERQLSPDLPQEYRFTLKAGEYARLLVTQKSVRAHVVILTADAQRLFEFTNTPIGGTASAEFVAGTSGEWRVRLEAAERTAPVGSFEIELSKVEPATDRHKARAAGSLASARATAARVPRRRETTLEAIALHEESARHWKAAQDPVYHAAALYAIADAYADIGERENALRYANESLVIARESKDPAAEAWALNAIGAVHNLFGDRRKAIEYLTHALPLMRASKNRLGEGTVLNGLSMAHVYIGEIRKGLGLFGEAQTVFTEMQDRRNLATLSSNIGVTHGDLGEYRTALDHYQRALALHRELGNRSGEAVTQNNMGTAYSSLAEYQKALDAYRAALEIHRSLGQNWSEAISLHNIAWVYATLGDRLRARTLYQEALAILRKIKDQRGMSNTLGNLGEIAAELGDHGNALAYHNEALQLRRAVGDRVGEASSLDKLGKAYARLHKLDKAREHADMAVAILRPTGNRRRLVAALQGSGALWRQVGDRDKAGQVLEEALTIARQIHDRRSEADTLAELARLERDRGDAEKAHRRAAEALAALEALRLSVASPQLRAWFFELKRDVLEMDIGLLMRLHFNQPGEGFAAAALLGSERSKARSLLELLGENSVEIRRGVDERLLERERELERLIFAKAEQQTRLLNTKFTSAPAAISKELSDLTTEMEHVQSRIRDTSPDYAALTQPEPLNLKQIRERVLDDDTVLLEFSLGAERSFLWAVTASSLDVYALPPRAEIEAGARRLYTLLTARAQNSGNEPPAARALRIRQADASYFAAAASLSRMLLGQAASKLANKRLLIVADGVLQYLPFASLPEPAPEGAKSPPLIVNHEVVSLPSASVVAVIRQELARRKPVSKALAILADPVFDAADARVEWTAGTRSSTADSMQFVRLRFSRTEAEEISRLAPAGTTFKALDFDASRETALTAGLGQYRIIHFATHSVLNNEHPELSGVVLSRVDRNGQPRNGFLRLYDIYNLRLGSELVVLSACETALGGEIKGEGLIGLTRGFLYAGAPRVVATLWKVDDRTTAEVMKRFYQSMLANGERPAAALRSAQISMWKTKGWDVPYHWAAFTLQGEWR
ncbi:MAG: CHAT domain-containing protein [Acidobacteria bacterium]|nr:CHAT domain-containing protein [Acidobacteriota bacterium]